MDTKEVGWIHLHRQILNNPIFSKPHYLSVWMYILLRAVYRKESSFIWNEKRQTLRRGQLLTGTKKIAEKTGVATGTVYRILKYLENEKQIETRKTTKFTIITVLNWDKYQVDEQQNEERTKNRRRTDEEQMNTFKEVKNIRKKKNISKDIEGEPSYGKADVNKFIASINRHLPYNLPQDNRSRFTAATMLKLLNKHGVKGVKKGRDFLKDDIWKNAEWWFSDYMESYVNEGYGVQSWYKLMDSLKLWMANEGQYPQQNKFNK